MLLNTKPVTLNTDFEVVALKKSKPKVIERKKIHTSTGNIWYPEAP